MPADDSAHRSARVDRALPDRAGSADQHRQVRAREERQRRARRIADDNVTLLIEDDGIGIPEDAQNNLLSHGIAGMRQRVRALHGEFSIGRRPEGGTMIEVNIPLERPPREQTRAARAGDAGLSA